MHHFVRSTNYQNKDLSCQYNIWLIIETLGICHDLKAVSNRDIEFIKAVLLCCEHRHLLIFASHTGVYIVQLGA